MTLVVEDETGCGDIYTFFCDGCGDHVHGGDRKPAQKMCKTMIEFHEWINLSRKGRQLHFCCEECKQQWLKDYELNKKEFWDWDSNFYDFCSAKNSPVKAKINLSDDYITEPPMIL